MGINVDSETLSNMADILGCTTGRMPFSYLGVRVGIRSNCAAEWNPVVKKIRNRLKKWEDSKISFGGRITLLNLVLSSIPIYYLSFYRLPKKNLREIVSLQRNFLWGGGECSKKIPWVKWNIICKPKLLGGTWGEGFRSI